MAIKLTARAQVTSKGQVTIPKAIRTTLDISEGDQVTFEVEQDEVTIHKTPNFADLSGILKPDHDHENVDFETARATAWSTRVDQLKNSQA